MEVLSRLFEDKTAPELFTALFIVAETLALCSVPSVLLRRRGRPTAALAWLLALFALPALGGLLWWAFGRTHLERKRRRRSRMAAEFNRLKDGPSAPPSTAFDRLIPRRAVGTSVFPTGGNEVELLIDGARAYPAMEQAIGSAGESINALFYIWHTDATGLRLRDMLVEKAKAGVQVRVLVDAFGSDKFDREFEAPLIEAGAKIAQFFPSPFDALGAPRFNFRNHRKILVVDNRVAFTGGMNIGNEYAHEWRDLMVQLRGPVVQSLQYVFLDDWYFATGESVDDQPTQVGSAAVGDTDAAVVASGPDSEHWIHDAYFTAVSRAERRIWIATPYFIPTAALMTALRTAAGRGVEVGLIVPEFTDVWLVKWAARSYYKDLLDAGVSVYEYQGRMLHAKALLVDDEHISVGTANLDTRSFRLSFEVGCFFASKALNDQLWHWFQELKAESILVSSQELERAPVTRKLLESMAHLLSPLL
jgi:cardiolipin synthase